MDALLLVRGKVDGFGDAYDLVFFADGTEEVSFHRSEPPDLMLSARA